MNELQQRAYTVLMKLCLDNKIVSSSGEYKRILLGMPEDLLAKKVQNKIIERTMGCLK